MSRPNRLLPDTSRVSTRVIIAFVFVFGLCGVFRNMVAMRQLLFVMDEKEVSDGPTVQKGGTKTTVAYAVTLTHFGEAAGKYIDRAAVLHQSIKLAMQKSPRYDYHIYAFVHKEAIEAKPFLEKLGYRVQIKDTPFNITEIDNFDLVDGQRIGCCGEKEYLKLYSYLLLDYPVAVHLDLDTIVFRPMDDVFDFMTLTQTTPTKLTVDQVDSFARTSSMWMNKRFDVSKTHASRTVLTKPERINLMFTRDYNMVDPPSLKPYQMGVQGGFLAVRPNRRDFDRMVNIIQTGGDFKESKWGYGKLGNDGYGGYYGAATIQGLASYYYDHYEKGTRSIELNRCNYNSMVDNPLRFNKKLNKSLCTTTEDDCEDCRETKFEDIYTSHLTVCGKPEVCQQRRQPPNALCGRILHEWHKTRLSLETEWMHRFSSLDVPYVPELKPKNGDKEKYLGHCDGDRYIPLVLPSFEDSTTGSFI